ncbi:hypothetical protein LEP1GSC187_3270 [Leptospira santarosai str. ZUN179]|uniref:Uncharacterized protein n=1 Tax=Leptospira santarosai str. ZUN179 TaxID=1049985 RepID=M6UKD9_9LEPT|nr:hypothetical protein LEP1GSC187_3270 [Leptospira santarosai str. ZUN179]
MLKVHPETSALFRVFILNFLFLRPALIHRNSKHFFVYLSPIV